MKHNQSYDPSGPAVLLGTASSLFPLHLARHWRSLGMEVALVARDARRSEVLSDGTRLVSHRDFSGVSDLFAKGLSPLLHQAEKFFVYMHKSEYRRRTGRHEPDPWEPYFVNHVLSAFSVARAARSMRPRYVFGHEVGAYGFATALCRGIPKILFPWGADVFLSAETSPLFYKLIKYSLNSADLIVPSSFTAASHICNRFEICSDKVRALSWGVDRKLFRRASFEERQRLCSRWNIDPSAMIFLNPRRFRPAWGCFVALEAFIQIALEYSNTHFVMFGGLGTEEYIGQARKKICEMGLSPRFTLLDGETSLVTCAEFMSVSDVFVSLLGLGDMRSWSVTQATASGGIPIVSDTPEYREMVKQGFSAVLVNQESVKDVYEALSFLMQHPVDVLHMRAKNNKYICDYEDYDKQMFLMLDLINEVCSRYCER